MICIYCGNEAGKGLDECWWCFAKRVRIGPYRRRNLKDIVEEEKYENPDEAIKEKF